MKKKYLAIIFVVVFCELSISQVQRMVLWEVFSEWDCVPCASSSMSLLNFLNNNRDKVIGIRYQANMPGADPWAYSRDMYYNVNGYPFHALDGIIYSHYSSSLYGTDVNERYAISTPFALTINHSFNASYDSIFINTVITTPEAYSNNNADFKLHIALIEKNICYNIPPGINGETDFYRVVKRMYPNVNGTQLPNSWNANDSLEINFYVPIPDHIQDKSEILFVAFIQNNTNKEVFQAAITEQKNYAKITEILGIDEFVCHNDISTINPTVVISNLGFNEVTTALINYQLNNQSIQTIMWNGSLSPNSTDTVNLPIDLSNISAGTNTLVAWLTNINNNGIHVVGNCNISKFSFYLAPSTAHNGPFTISFDSLTFPQNGFGLLNPDNKITWKVVSEGYPENSIMLSSFNYLTIGEKDAIILYPINLSTLDNPILSFDVAHYSYYFWPHDNLKVEVSNDCGQSWFLFYNKTGNTLGTVNGGYNFSFSPNFNQWRHEQIDLSNLAYVNKLFIKFTSTNGKNNNIYIDNIKITSYNTVLEEANSSPLHIYPNPSKELVNIRLLLSQPKEVKIIFRNMIGEIAMIDEKGLLWTGEHLFQFNVSSLASGIYNVTIYLGEEVGNHRLIIIK